MQSFLSQCHTPLIWITGMPGSGKTTLANQLVTFIRENGRECLHLDGDKLREIFGKENQTIDYSVQSRSEIALIYSKLALHLNSQGVTTVVSTVSLFWDVQIHNRMNAEKYFEVFLDVEQGLLENGPRTALYNSGIRVEIDPEFPKRPELTLRANSSTDRNTWFDTLIYELSSFYE